MRFKREENWWFAQSSGGTRVLESVRAQNGEVSTRRRAPKMLRVRSKTRKRGDGCVFLHPAFGEVPLRNESEMLQDTQKPPRRSKFRNDSQPQRCAR